MDGVRDRRDHRQERPLARFLGAERALRVVGLDEDRVDLGRLERGRTLVVEHRRLLVQILPEDLLLHQGLADAHVHRALDLPLDQQRVQRAADVVTDPHVLEIDGARLLVDGQLDHARRIRIARRRADATALVLARALGRRVRAGKGEDAVEGFAELDGPREQHGLVPVVGHADPALARDERRRAHLELLRDRLEDGIAQPLGRLDRRHPAHERHARRVRAEIDGGEARVGRMHVDVLRLDAEHLRGQVGEDGVRALTDVGGAAEDGDAAAAIGPSDDARMRHVVPVDRGPGAGEIGGARDSQAASLRRAPRRPVGPCGHTVARALVAPARGFDDLVDALAEPDGRDRQMVRRLGERIGDDPPPHLGGVEPELLGRLVELTLEREAGLRRAVPALGSTRRLVGEDARGLELVHGDLVGDRIDHARVEGGRDAVGAVRAAVEPRPEVTAGDVTLSREAGLDPHENGMPAAVRIEDLFAGQRDLHRPSRQFRELAGHDLVREGIGLAAEAAADRCRDHADVGGRRVEDLGEHPVHVVRRLGRGPERELAVRRPVGDGRVLLHRQMVVALEKEHVLANQIGAVEGGVDVAELERDVLVHVRTVTILVDPDLGVRQRLEDRHQRRERLVVDVDQPGCLLGGLFVDGGDRGDRVADHADLLGAEGFLVLGHGQDPELHARQVRRRDDREDARQRASPRRVDRANARVGVGAAKQLGVGHARQEQIVGILRLPDDLRPRVDFRERPADDRELVLGHARAS